MNLNHACHMQLAAEDPAKAFGPRGINVVIAGHPCLVNRIVPGWWRIVDDYNHYYDFISKHPWGEVKAQIESWLIEMDKGQ